MLQYMKPKVAGERHGGRVWKEGEKSQGQNQVGNVQEDGLGDHWNIRNL